MHLFTNRLIFIITILFSSVLLFGQTTIPIGCQSTADGFVGIDRKIFPDFHSEGVFLNFDIPASSGDCMKITEVNYTISINGVDDSGLDANCLLDFWMNAYVGNTLDFAESSVTTNLEFVSFPEFNISDLAGTYSVDCNTLDLPFGGQVGVDVIARHGGNGNCPNPDSYVSDGHVIMDYEVCVEIVVESAGDAEVIANSNDTEFCIGQQLELNEGGLSNADWEWSGPNFSANGNSSESYILADASDFGDYIVTVTDVDGCTNSQTISISQLPSPNANASAPNDMICTGDAIAITEDAGDATAWQWDGPNGFMIANQDVNINPSLAANIGIYTVTITDGNGCTNTSELEVFPGTDVNVDVSALSTEVCTDQTISLEENGGDGLNWSWEGPDGFTSNQEDPEIFNSTSDNLGTYMVTVSAAGFCDSEGSVTISAATPPNIILDITNPNVCIGQDINLEGTGGGGGASWNWEGPNGFTSNDENPTVNTSSDLDFGTFTATVTDGNGCTNSTTITVNPIAGPELLITGFGDVCEGTCGVSNPSFAIEINPSSTILDVELTFPGTGIPSVVLENLADGDIISVCSDSDPFFNDPDFNGFDLILPTNGLNDGDNISVGILDIVDPSNPTCPAILNTSTSINFSYEQATPLEIEYGGSTLSDGDQIACDNNFNPVLSSNVNGDWSLDGTPITLPVDLTGFGAGLMDLVFEPNGDDCVSRAEVEIELLPCACDITDGLITNIVCDPGFDPTSSSDDFISFTLDPQVLNGGTSYSLDVSAGNVFPAGGVYGIETVFSLNNGSAGAGDLIVTIIDDEDNTCTLMVDLVDPGSCTEACAITSVNILSVVCNDFLTPTDASDDFIVYEIEVLGTNTSTNYTITTIHGTELGDYGVVQTFSFPAGTAGAGNIDLQITDNGGDVNCNFTEELIDPGSCSGQCNITAALISEPVCNDGGTPETPDDDFIVFEIDVFGDNLSGGYTLVPVSGSVTPTTGEYSSTETFQLQAGSAGSGGVNMLIVDNADTNCDFEIFIQDPGQCSEAESCDITSAVPVGVLCNNNGTPTDPSDDFVTFELNPQGTNLTGNYTLQGTEVTSGPENQGEFGTGIGFATIPGTAGNGPIALNIFSNDDPSCAAGVIVIDPGTCSDENCIIDAIEFSNLTCLDNATPNDPSDDFIMFSITVAGENTSTMYSIETAFGNFDGTYGIEETFTMQQGSGAAGNIPLQIIDSADPTCVTPTTLPNPCGQTCIITGAMPTNISCNDSGTPNNSDDDFVTFDLNPQGNNLTGSYTLEGTSAPISPDNQGAFGVSGSFSTLAGSAGNGPIELTISSNDDPNCTITFSIEDPGACSGCLDPTPCDDGDCTNGVEFWNEEICECDVEVSIFGCTDPSATNYNPIATCDNGECMYPCSIVDLMLTNVSCQDNGTDSDDTDDIIIFSLNPQVIDGSNGYMVSSANGNVTPAMADYGEAQIFVLDVGTAGGGDVIVTIEDQEDTNCVEVLTIEDPGTCSGTCNIISAEISQVACTDPSTPLDPSDDIIVFNLIVSGTNTSSGYTIMTDLGDIIGDYNVDEPLGISSAAGNGDVTIEIVDNENPSCTFQVILEDPGSCSEACAITNVLVSNVTCQDNGTDSDDTDDIISFSLDPEVMNGGTDYTVTLDVGFIVPNTGTYGEVTDFVLDPGTAGGGDFTITVFDTDNPTCAFDVDIIDPGTCSGTCNISSVTISNIICDDANSPANPADDFIAYDIEVLGTNTSSGYLIESDYPTERGEYGSNFTFTLPEGSAGAGDVTLTVIDGQDPSCAFEIILEDPGVCSSPCEITLVFIDAVMCNDAGTPTDDTDDYITYSIVVEGTNTSDEYRIQTDLGPDEIGEYDVSMTFDLPAGSVGGGNISIQIQDLNAQAGDCIFDAEIPDPGSCATVCELTDVVINDSECNDNGTPDDPSDDYFDFEIDPQGTNLSGGFTLAGTGIDITEQQIFGVNSAFSTTPGSAGQGDIMITLTSEDDPDCNIEFTLFDQGTCSDECFDPGDCDDEDCTNGIETWDSTICDCVSTGMPDCDEDETIEIACDDGSPLTDNDVETVLACDNTIVCVPCTGDLNVPTYFIPNVITPNDDLDNDEFRVYSEIEFLIEEFSIYDRWGNKIFSMTNILNTDPLSKWDGTFDGQAVIPGVYIYYLRLGEPFDNEVDVGDLTVY